jgi:hypothetical protein
MIALYGDSSMYYVGLCTVSADSCAVMVACTK